jgi:hypothetical protein
MLRFTAIETLRNSSKCSKPNNDKVFNLAIYTNAEEEAMIDEMEINDRNGYINVRKVA